MRPNAADGEDPLVQPLAADAERVLAGSGSGPATYPSSEIAKLWTRSLGTAPPG